MLVVKRVEAEVEGELAYECYENGVKVGRVVGQFRPNGGLEARLFDTSKLEAGRTLLAKLERDAAANGVEELYFGARDEKERDQFLPAGYEPVEEDSLLLCKRLGG